MRKQRKLKMHKDVASEDIKTAPDLGMTAHAVLKDTVPAPVDKPNKAAQKSI